MLKEAGIFTGFFSLKKLFTVFTSKYSANQQSEIRSLHVYTGLLGVFLFF